MNPEDVPAGSVALDTDVFSLIHLKKGRHEEFARLLVGHDPFALSFAVVGELKVLPLRTKPPWGIKRREELEAAITRCVVLPATGAVVDEWARLSARFLHKLKGQGINDMWTAAVASSTTFRWRPTTSLISRRSPPSFRSGSSTPTSNAPGLPAPSRPRAGSPPAPPGRSPGRAPGTARG